MESLKKINKKSNPLLKLNVCVVVLPQQILGHFLCDNVMIMSQRQAQTKVAKLKLFKIHPMVTFYNCEIVLKEKLLI